MKTIKIISKILCIYLLLSVYFCIISYAEDEIVSGKFGDNITWTLEKNVLTLSGNGATFDFNADVVNPSIESMYRNKVSTLVIGEGITSVGKNAFNGFYYLENVSFPSTLEQIGERAFYDANIKSLNFPENCALSVIEKEAFASIFPLNSVDLSNCKNLNTIDEKAFSDCNELTYVDFPFDSVFNTIGDAAFEKNTNIIRISIPDTVRYIGDGAFFGCNAMISAEIPESVNYIGENAFKGTIAVIFGKSGSEAQRAAKAHSLRFVDGDASQAVVIRQGRVSETVSWTFDTNGTLVVSGEGYIGDFPSSVSAPWYHISYAMTSVIIEEGITGIGRENFANFRNLKNVTLPSTISVIGDYAFMGCRSIEEIKLPEGLATIGADAFYCCETLKEFHIPSTTYYIDVWAIYFLESLEKFSVADGNTVFSTDENGVLFSYDKTRLIKYPISSKNKTYTIPETVTTIDPQAFADAKYLEEVSFAKNSTLEKIDYAVFTNSAIKKISLPDGIKTIESHAFSGCDQLETIVWPASLETIGDWAFGRAAISSLELPQTLRIIGNHAFSDCNNLKEIVLPEGINAVGTGTFSNCENLESLYLPASLTWIDISTTGAGIPKLSKILVSPYNFCYSTDEYGALYFNKTELVWYPRLSEHKSYKIPEGTIKIHPNVFSRATNLLEIILPETLTEISHNAFDGCKGLESITIPASVKIIDTSAFRYCSNLSEIIFAQDSQLESISNSAFSGCESLKEFYLPDSIKEVRYNAFNGCTMLESFYVGEKSLLNNIAEYTFQNCPFVNIIAPDGTYADIYAKKNRIDKRITVILDGKEINFEVYPVIRNGRTLVPMRKVFEALGAPVEWSEETKTVMSKKDEIEISVTIDSDIMLVNGEERKLDCEAIIIANRTLVPIRAISEAFGYEVSWNDAHRMVEITSK